MKKGELIEALAAATEQSQTQAARSLDSVLGIISAQLAKGDDVAITGFGTFKVSNRPARTGRNPRDGAAMQIAASNAVRFAPGATLKAAVNPAK